MLLEIIVILYGYHHLCMHTLLFGAKSTSSSSSCQLRSTSEVFTKMEYSVLALGLSASSETPL